MGYGWLQENICEPTMPAKRIVYAVPDVGASVGVLASAASVGVVASAASEATALSPTSEATPLSPASVGTGAGAQAPSVAKVITVVPKRANEVGDESLECEDFMGMRSIVRATDAKERFSAGRCDRLPHPVRGQSASCR